MVPVPYLDQNIPTVPVPQNCRYDDDGFTRRNNGKIVACKIYSLLKIAVPINSSKKLSQNVSDVIVYRIHNGPRWKLKHNTRK